MKIAISYVRFEVEFKGYLLTRTYHYQTGREALAAIEGIKNAYYHNNYQGYINDFKDVPPKALHDFKRREEHIAYYNAAHDAERSYGFAIMPWNESLGIK